MQILKGLPRGLLQVLILRDLRADDFGQNQAKRGTRPQGKEGKVGAGRLLEAEELFVPDGGDELEFGGHTDVAVVGAIGVAEVAVGFEDFAAEERVCGLFEDGGKVGNESHSFCCSVAMRMNRTSLRRELPRSGLD